MPLKIEFVAPLPTVEPHSTVDLEVDVELDAARDDRLHVHLIVSKEGGESKEYDSPKRAHPGQLKFREPLAPFTLHAEGNYVLRADLFAGNVRLATSPEIRLRASPFPEGVRDTFGSRPVRAPDVPTVHRVALQRSAVPQTEDEVLWMAIRHSTANLSYPSYCRFVEELLCPEDARSPNCPPFTDEEDVADRHLKHERLNTLAKRRALPFPGVDGYRWLKVATEVFVMASCGVIPTLTDRDVREEERRTGAPFSGNPNVELEKYLGVPPGKKNHDEMLPYLQLVSAKLQDSRILRGSDHMDDGKIEACYGILQRKLSFPCMIELIWSYWHEEGMLVQAMNAISQRFQNRRAPGDRDPLAQLEIDPLRPLNNLLWGYIQDEQHRLSVIRRAHEYDHHYGITLHGRAVTSLRTADSRSKFLESFHNLLYKCTQFYKQDDDATVVADGFPVLNAIKETHYLLAQGAHNQFGDLPSTARQEMLMQQWLLARPEMREFLGGRVMVPHPEPWMDRVDAMKSLQGWTDTGAVHFHDLGVFGEQVLLAIRYGGWSLINDRDFAANWARSWRTEIQGYIHAYRAVTGVDLATDPSSQRNIEERNLPPSVHLRNRLASQRRR